MQVGPYTFDFPAYDAGAYIRANMMKVPSNDAIYKDRTYASALYVNMPLALEKQLWLSNGVTTKIRISKPYQRYYSSPMPAGSTDSTARTLPKAILTTPTAAIPLSQTAEMPARM